MAKRRRVLMGLGALVFGSGAMTVQAGFTDSFNSTSDMRVVADASLLVQAGTIFRSGSGVGGTFEPSLETPGPNGEVLFDGDSKSFFGGIGHDDLDALDSSNVPAVAVNNAENDSLSLKTAMLQSDDSQFGEPGNGVLQVINQKDAPQYVSIRYSSFGDDTAPNGGPVTKADVANVIKFKIGSNQISPTSGGIGSSPQEVDYNVEVPAGGSKQIWIDYDTTQAANNIDSAASVSGSGFGPDTDTVQLLEEIKIGLENGNDAANDQT
jgi:hypothetical protein